MGYLHTITHRAPHRRDLSRGRVLLRLLLKEIVRPAQHCGRIYTAMMVRCVGQWSETARGDFAVKRLLAPQRHIAQGAEPILHTSTLRVNFLALQRCPATVRSARVAGRKKVPRGFRMRFVGKRSSTTSPSGPLCALWSIPEHTGPQTTAVKCPYIVTRCLGPSKAPSPQPPIKTKAFTSTLRAPRSAAPPPLPRTRRCTRLILSKQLYSATWLYSCEQRCTPPPKWVFLFWVVV